MDEEDAVKAPVTRLRRRLSVEGEVGSPAAPSTPTKKRLAAKPQLDNIDELAPVNSPRRKPRSTSVRSTTDGPEERAVTPARRSTRIKSNTSITSETHQSLDSPRAKRAARRNSTAGSDTEAPLTPVKKSTRKTRKDSASSVENQEVVTKPTIQIANETISEEPEAPKASANNSLSHKNNSPTSDKSSRKITRSKNEDSNKNSPTIVHSDSDTISIPITIDQRSASEKPDAHKTSAKNSLSDDSPNSVRKSLRIAAKRNSLNKSESESDKSLKLKNNSNKSNSDSNSNLNKSKLKDDVISSPNLSTPVQCCEELTTGLKNRKSRSKSMTNISGQNENQSQIKLKTYANRSFNCKKLSNDVGAGDAYVFGYKNANRSNQSLSSPNEENIDVILKAVNKKSSIQSESAMNNTSTASKKSENGKNKRKSSDKPDGIDTVDTSENKVARDLEFDNLLHETKTYDKISYNVYIEDSNSNTGRIGKDNIASPTNPDDQCVPVIDKLNEFDEKAITGTCTELEREKSTLFASKTLNSSVEPMDIDESIPVNVSLINNSADQHSMNDSTKRYGHVSNLCAKKLNSDSNESTINGFNPHKSPLSCPHEKTSNENKSTLILSQLKDDSAASDGNVTKSPLKKDKSLTNANVSKSEIDKKRHSIVEKSSQTPPKNKLLQKTGMQTSTPVIPTHNDNKDKKSEIAAPKNSSKISKTDNTESSNESSDLSDEEMSQDKSDLLHDEAEDAGDDYESGDSQDESQRRYEKENEIVEKGETLTSNDDISDDSDYEKDSFVVSSAEEDYELQSGSGDDLSLGNDELNMTAKSKQKYNARKMKEQKKASREMYEAKHGKKSLTESSDDETSKPAKKNKRQRIDSSLLRSDDDTSITKPRKNNRLRLDSTNDASAVKSDADETISKKILEDSITNEKEISLVGNESILQKKDPLKTAVKAEPMTPQKDFNISTVQFSAVMDVEQVQVNQNASILKANESSDPLQSTTAFDHEESDSSSGNEEIMQNYDSMLSNLNKETKKSVKKHDISLDLNKKSKKKPDPIIDQLNLTQLKGVHNPKGESTKSHDRSAFNKANKSNINALDDESSSDSIELKLLFPDDTSESSVEIKKVTKKSSYPNNEDFIPLKRAEGKTNLLESIAAQKPEMSLTKNQKKNKSSSESSNVEVSYVKNASIAELAGETSENTLSKTPGSSKKKKKMSESSGVQSAPIISEDLMPSSNKKNKNKSINLSYELPIENDATNSSKKKKKISECSIVTDSNDKGETPEETKSKTPGSSKKKNRKSSESSEVQLETDIIGDHNVSTGGKNKSKRNSNSESSTIEVLVDKNIEENPIIIEDRTPLSVKEQSNNVPVEIDIDVSVTNSSKKKKKLSASSVTADFNETEGTTFILTPTNKIKSKRPETLTEDQIDGANIVEEAAPSSVMKKNRKSSEQNEAKLPSEMLQINSSISKKDRKLSGTSVMTAEDINFQAAIDKSSKKNKKRNSSEPSQTTNEETTVPLVQNTEAQEGKASKRKRNSSVTQELVLDSLLDNPHDLLLTAGRQNKKMKTSKNIGTDEESQEQEKEIIFNKEEKMNAQQNYNSNKKKTLSHFEMENPVIPDNSNKTHRNKKRKQRGDNENPKQSKAFQDTFLENITVPRLPTTILDRLDEKPTSKEAGRKSAIVSTSTFEVVETRPRKNKPSQYLEESIYLNDDDSPDKKRRKRNIEKPKVLPFIPTASTSTAGYTTNFKVNVNSRQTSFIAQPSDLPNFKKDYLLNKKIKKLGTFEMYKKQRSVKLCKF